MKEVFGVPIAAAILFLVWSCDNETASPACDTGKFSITLEASAAGTKYRDIKWSLLSPYYVTRCSHSPAIIAPRALYGNKIATFYYPVT